MENLQQPESSNSIYYNSVLSLILTWLSLTIGYHSLGLELQVFRELLNAGDKLEKIAAPKITFRDTYYHLIDCSQTVFQGVGLSPLFFHNNHSISLSSALWHREEHRQVTYRHSPKC